MCYNFIMKFFKLNVLKETKFLNIKLMVLLPLIVLCSYEFFYRGVDLFVWMVLHPNQFILTYAIVFGLINIFYVFPRKIYISFGIVILSFFTFVGVVCRQKLLLRGEPLVPWDLYLGREAWNIIQSMKLFAIAIILVFVIFTIGAIIFCNRRFPEEKYKASVKIVTGILSFALFFSLVELVPLQKTFSLRMINWSQEMNYAENGIMLGLLINSTLDNVEKPGDYNQETIKTIMGHTATDYATDSDFTPNVIIVMSEAFWDPTVMKEVSFSKDPIPYFHYLEKNYTNGTMLSPVFAGGTANTEFELLTGFSTRFLPAGIIPYVQFINKPIEALPAIFKRQGYEATAIHTHHSWFYRRNIVYQDLGFDQFISKEYFNDPEYKGQYIRDTELSKKILEKLAESRKPDFIFAVSMEAHGPYNVDIPLKDIEVSGNLTPESKQLLKNYTNIISDVDKSLELLINELNQTDEPTIVVFFGDHLPLLGKDSEVYREANYLSADNPSEDYLKKYGVPFIVWDNFSNTREENLLLSSNFLGSYILELSKKEGSTMTNFLQTLRNENAEVLTNTGFLDSEQISEKELNQYRLLQYDFLNGNEYAYIFDPLNRPDANKSYILGNKPNDNALLQKNPN